MYLLLYSYLHLFQFFHLLHYQLQHKLHIVNSEITECQEERIKLREELSQQLESLEKQLKLRQLIIENFIQPSECQRVRDRAVYEDDRWVLTPMDNKRYVHL